MNKPIADTKSPLSPTTFAGLPLPVGVHLDLDPLDGSCHMLLAVTGPDGGAGE